MMALIARDGYGSVMRKRERMRTSLVGDHAGRPATPSRALCRWQVATFALLATYACAAAEPSSANFTIQRSTLSPGATATASAHFIVTASLGDAVQTDTLRGAAVEMQTGFWPTVAVARPICLLDVDGDGVANATTDGVLISRAMFGFTGAAVIGNAVGPTATRTTWASIQPKIHFRALDIDGNGSTSALSDGLILMRAMLGLTGTAVTNGAVAPGATRATWPAIRTYLNTRCGMSFSP